SVGVAAQQQTAGGYRRAAATAHAVRRFVLPRDFVRSAVDGGENAVERRIVSRLLTAARVDLAAAVLPRKSLEDTGADRPGHVEIAGIRAVRHRRPVGAALTGRLERYRLLPER